MQGILLHFKTCYIISGLFSKKCHLLHNIAFLCSNNTSAFHKPCARI